MSLITSAKDIEILTGILIDVGIHGIEIIDANEMHLFLSETSNHWDYVDESLLSCSGAAPVIVFYLGTDNASYASLDSLKARLNELESSHIIDPVSITHERVNDQDWLHEWKKHFHEIEIGKILVRPVWESQCAINDRIVFAIDPGSAFGTGQHPTTAMCIKALSDEVNISDVVLDIGCGSGILSIISLLLGARKVVCCDVDPTIKEVVERNARINSIDMNALEILIGDITTNSSVLEEIARLKYDVIAANIVADVIISIAPLAKRLLKQDGIFITSGIIDDRIENVCTELVKCGFTIKRQEHIDGWYCVIANG